MSRKHRQHPPKRIPGPVVFGLLLMGIGAVALSHNLGLLQYDRVWRLWPAVFLFGGVVKLVNDGFFSVGAHVNLVAGLLLLGGFNRYAPEVETYWPLGLVWIGLVMLGRALMPSPPPPVSEPLSPPPPIPQDEDARPS